MSDSAISPPTGPTVDVRLLYGPLLIGVFFNMILFGVLITQQLTYLATSRRDPPWLRIMVWSIFLVETANTAFDISVIYQPLILQYGGVPNNLPTLFITQPLCVIIVGFPIQLFFIWRIRSLTQRTILPSIILMFSLVALGGGIWTTAMVPVTGTFNRIPMLYRSAQVWLIASAVTDLSIAFMLALALRSKKTGLVVTDSVVDNIVRMTVQTGMLTALFSILDVVCFMTLQGETVNFVWNIPLSKLYAICLMSTLNARERLNHAMAMDKQLAERNFTNVVLTGPLFREEDFKEETQSSSSTETPGETIDGLSYGGSIGMTKIVEPV
ncbi:hypothetical protein C8R46DRAFT_1349308 [Mycena filopes]|nr:hypothetical protein C8R46DRAFT_1349308 [Mycena filopes]